MQKNQFLLLKKLKNTSSAQLCKFCALGIDGLTRSVLQSWALEVFLNFFNNKKWFFCIFIKLVTYFCTSPIKKALSQSY